MMHLNYFIALWVGLSVVTIQFIGGLLMAVMSVFKLDKFLMLGYATIPVLIFVCLIVIWQRYKIVSPVGREARKFRRFAVGHGAIFVGHVLIVMPLLYSAWVLTLNRSDGHITVSALYTSAGLMAALPFYLLGIVCLETIRYRIPRQLC